MVKMTSASANKLLNKLNEEKRYWTSKEEEGCTYVAALDEEPLIPSYSYEEVSQKITEIDEKVLKIKHAINISNATNEIEIGDTKMTVDMILVKMAQLNRRKDMYNFMRRQEPKTRLNSGRFTTKNSVPEYRYINYDLNRAEEDFQRVDEEIVGMQLALDKYNQTVEFEVDF